ncbi:MAG: methyltransferase, partial [Anaerolineae bacterium]|nr:methyltransferase [Anaerolineae bacterium]
RESLQKMVHQGVDLFDLVFIDADKPGYPEYLHLAVKLCRVGGLIVADNVIRNGEVIKENSQDVNAQAMRVFNAELGKEKGLLATVIQTVGKKGYDGFAIALVTGEGG